MLFAGICALILTVGLARFAYTPLLPIMRNQAGLSYLAGGWLATFNYLGYISGGLLAASINSLPLKFRLYRIGLVAGVASTAAMGWTDDVVLWAVLRYVAGLSSAAGMLLASGLILNWLIRNGHRPELGLHFTGLGLGIMVSGIAVAAMGPVLGWAQQWVGLGVLGLIFLVPAWLWVPRPPPSQPGAVLASSVETDRRWMRLLIGSYFCAGVGYVISATFIVSILESLPMFNGKGSWAWIILGAAAVPSSFVWDRVADAVGQIGALLLAYGLQLVSILIPVLSHGGALNLLGAILYGGTFAGIVSLTLALVGRRYPANPAKAMARLTLSYGVAQILAPALAGTIARSTGSYAQALIVAAAALMVGMGLLYQMTRGPNRQS